MAIWNIYHQLYYPVYVAGRLLFASWLLLHTWSRVELSHILSAAERGHVPCVPRHPFWSGFVRAAGSTSPAGEGINTLAPRLPVAVHLCHPDWKQLPILQAAYPQARGRMQHRFAHRVINVIYIVFAWLLPKQLLKRQSHPYMEAGHFRLQSAWLSAYM